VNNPTPTAHERLRERLLGHFQGPRSHVTSTTSAQPAAPTSPHPLALTECSSFSDLVAPTTTNAASPRNAYRRLLIQGTPRPRSLRVADRLDLIADAYLVDHLLGTLALIHLIEPTPDDSSNPPADSLRSTIEQRLSQASYLRHLLLEAVRPDGIQVGTSPYTVEVVFVPTTADLETPLGTALQEIARELPILHAVGVNMLEGARVLAPISGTPNPADEAQRASCLRRAFPWLLHETHDWLTSSLPTPPDSSPTTPSTPPPPWIPAIPPPIPLSSPSQASQPRPEKPSDFLRRPDGLPAGAPETTFPGMPSELCLLHFRLRGLRRWRFAPNRMLHVVHGHNGSGKSSVVEALELITTGKVERIANRNEDCRTVITNRDYQDSEPTTDPESRAAQVILRFLPPANTGTTTNPSRVSLVWKLHSQGVSRPLSPIEFAAPGAFRLNQDVIQLISRGSNESAEERQTRILTTFFPEEHALSRQVRDLNERLNQTLARIPTRLRSLFHNSTGAFDENLALSSLAWVQDTQIPWERVFSLLPLNTTQIQALLPLLPLTLDSAYNQSGTAASWEPVLNVATDLDRELQSLADRAPSLLNTFRSARAFLVAYQNAEADSSSSESRNLSDPFTTWLQCHAAADILAREHSLLETLEDLARDSTASLHAAFPQGALPALSQFLLSPKPPTPSTPALDVPDAKERSKRLSEVQERRDQAKAQLRRSRSVSSKNVAGAEVLPPLEQFDLTALDHTAQAGGFGRDLIGVTPSLSQAVRSAFASDGSIAPVTQGDRTVLRVGESDAFQTLITRLDAAIAAVEALPAIRPEFNEPVRGLRGVLDQFRTLRTALAERATLQVSAADRFRSRLASQLGPALNEFNDMITPARWAYPDLVQTTPHSESSASPSDPAADPTITPSSTTQLQLNTAQLSSFALTFFLLCHRAREHPLGIAILDDPFENMDELTVSTVARGLGRYLRLRARLGEGSQSWRLLLFVHGEQNVERIRREAPCATYRLPWLPPNARLGNEPPITAEPSQLRGDNLQDLSRIISDADES